MRFHVTSLPHTVAGDPRFCACAYTGKVERFCRMMRSLGHEVYHYGAEGSRVDCTEHTDVIGAEEQRQFFGGQNSTAMFPIVWDPKLPYWQLTNVRTADAIKKRQQREDFICIVGGNCQQLVAELVGESLSIVVEPFVGYRGVFAKYRAFETYTHQALVYGTLSPDPDASFYDAVIPNYYDPADFPLATKKKRGLLFIGRLIQRKGLQIALDVAKATGRPLTLAGQGVKEQTPEKIVTEEGMEIPLGKNIRYFGVANAVQRARLMGEAHAVLVPTIYMEPFGGVAVEAQLCGTPVITTDHAAFSETVRHGYSGYRCHTLEQFCWAVENTERLLSPADIQRRAIAKYGLGTVSLMYEEWFRMLLGLWDGGWPTLCATRSNLRWLNSTGL